MVKQAKPGSFPQRAFSSCIMVAKQYVNILGRIRNQECQKRVVGDWVQGIKPSGGIIRKEDKGCKDIISRGFFVFVF